MVSGLKDAEEITVKCHVCGGRLEATISDLPFRLGPNRIVVIKQLPVLECSDCTEFSIEDPIMEKVDNLLGQMDETAGLDPKDSMVSEITSDPLITIDTQILLGIGDDGCRTTRHLALNPESWRNLVTNLESFLQTKFHDKCLICGKSTTASNGAEEHVVLQGLGIKWGKLPAGIVCKCCNNGCSDAESRLLKLGLLGALRPFYVGSKKEKVFGDESTGKVILKNDPTDGFQMYFPYTKMEMPTSERGPGTLTIKVPLEEAATVHYSRALHKMAYLALATAHPNLALSEELSAVKQFIQCGAEEDYRPYCEDFVPGASPGVNIRFVVIGIKDKDNTIVLQKVLAALRIHHCCYSLSLVGDYPKEWRIGRYLGHAMEEGTRPAELTFRFDSVRPTND